MAVLGTREQGGGSVAVEVEAARRAHREYGAYLDALGNVQGESGEVIALFVSYSEWIVGRRRLWRRYLHSRFGFDVAREEFVSPAKQPRNVVEDARGCAAMAMYQQLNWCVRAVAVTMKRRPPDQDNAGVARAGLAAVASVLRAADYALVHAAMMHGPLEQVTGAATMVLSGMVADQTSLSRRRGLLAGIREAGKPDREAVLERLPSAVFEAWHDLRPPPTQDGLKTFSEAVVDRKLEPRAQDRLDKWAPYAPEGIDLPDFNTETPEAFVLREEAYRARREALRAKLSQNEWHALQLHSGGHSYREIAALLSTTSAPVSVQAVGVYLNRARTKGKALLAS